MFCSQCGNKLNGQIKCEKCGMEFPENYGAESAEPVNEDLNTNRNIEPITDTECETNDIEVLNDAVKGDEYGGTTAFCIQCGSELKGRTVCENCGTEVEKSVVDKGGLKSKINFKGKFKIIVILIVAVLLLRSCGAGKVNTPNGTLDDLNSDYYISYINERTIYVDDYSDKFKKKVKGTDDTVGEAVKKLAQLKAETRIYSKNPVEFVDTRVIDADGKGRFIVAMLVKKSAFHDAWLARIDIDAKTGTYVSRVAYHGEAILNGKGGSKDLQSIYESYIDEDWGEELIFND